jgi:Ca-activated chloride channel homolog
MTFIWPNMLPLLLLVPALAIAYILAQRRRQKYALRYASLSLVKEAMGRGPGFRRHIPPILFLLAFAAMMVGLARPVTTVTLPARDATIVLTIDVSGSMQADDLKPSRMEAAKTASRAFVNNEPSGVHVGVVSFSDNAAVVQAPTDDKAAVLAAIDRLQPQRATAIGRGLLVSLAAILESEGASQDAIAAAVSMDRSGSSNDPLGSPASSPNANTTASTPTAPQQQYSNAAIVLLSDGENNQSPAPLDIVDRVTAYGVHVYTVGVGSPDGTVLHIWGRSIRTRLDETTLKRIAETTGGTYYNASNENDLRSIYESLPTHLVMRTEKTEITALVTAAAAALSLLAGVFSLLWFNRLP